MLRHLAAFCYHAIYRLHHKLCLRPGAPLKNARLVVVGSYRTGGAGKTPFCSWLAESLSARGKRVAILCHKVAFDEAAMLRENFSKDPNVEVFATRNRYRLAHEIDSTGNFDFVLCDDGFEDSRLTGATTFALLWEDVPTRTRDLWPLGNARSLAKDHPGKSSFIEVRCGSANPDIRFVIDKVSNKADNVFCAAQNGWTDHRNGKINVFCGLGAPERFCTDLQEHGLPVTDKFFFKDHDRRFAPKLLRSAQKHRDETFVISEKDAARLRDRAGNPLPFPDNLYIARQKTDISETFAHTVMNELLNS